MSTRAWLSRTAAGLGLALPALAILLAARDLFVGDRLAFSRFAAAVLVVVPSLGTASLVWRRSSAAAAPPLLLVCGCASVWAIGALCGGGSPQLGSVAVLARALLPGALAHLILTFPREREILAEAPGLLVLVYALVLVLAGVGLVQAERVPALTALALHLAEGLAIAAWVGLLLACRVAGRESRSSLERARADVVLWGLLGVPAVSGLAALALSAGAAGAEPGAAVLGAVLLPVPIGYAVVRYQLFDVAHDVRRAVASLTHVSLSAAVLYGLGLCAMALPDVLPVETAHAGFAAAFTGFLLADRIRARLERGVQSWLEADARELDRIAAEHGQHMACSSELDQVAQQLCELVHGALAASGVSVFLRRGECGSPGATSSVSSATPGEVAAAESWWLGCARGHAARVDRASAGLAAASLVAREVVHLAREERHREPSHRHLRADGVELLAALRSRRQLLGLVLVSTAHDGRPYSSLQERFLRSACAPSALAIHRIELTQELLAAERDAAVGRLASGLAHDLGKPLGVVERLGRRWMARAHPGSRAARDAETVSQLAFETRETLRSVLDAAAADVAAPRSLHGEVDLDRALHRAVRAVCGDSWSRRVSLRRPPVLRPVPGDEDAVVRALVNVLDNALRASGGDDVVEVVVKSDGETCIDVVDRGAGMSAASARRAFDPFYSESRDAGGRGLGLTISRDLLESMGGRIDLDSRPGRGTRVRMRLPEATS